MVLVVNCQNGYMEKCNSNVLRNIVEAAELLDDVRMVTWGNPPDESFYKKIDWRTMKREYEISLYPELAKLGRPTFALKDPRDFPKEIHADLRKAKEITIIGANTDRWLVQVALEIWANRIKPTFIYDAWFSVGPKGCHNEAVNELTRQFGSVSFHGWESIKAPILKQREGLRSMMKDTSVSEAFSSPAPTAPPAPASEASAESDPPPPAPES